MRQMTHRRERTPRRRPAVAAVLLLSLSLLLPPSCGGQKSTPEGHAGHDSTTARESGDPIEQLWTCSMHPDIKMKEPGKCPICFMDLIPLEQESAGGGLDPGQLRMTRPAMALASIETAAVRRGEASATLRLYGTVEPDRSRVAVISARVAGRLEEVFVDYAGALVDEGDRLAELYSPGLLRAQEELLQAGAAIGDGPGGGSPLLEEAAARTYEAAREKLGLLGLTSGQIEAIERSGRVSDRLAIYSPIAGTVLSREAIEGDYVDEGSPLFTVADLSNVWVELSAYQSDLAWIRKGQQVTFGSEALPGVRYEGRTVFIDPVLERETRTAVVRAEAGNSDGRLKPGMFVTATLQARIGADGEVEDPSGPPPELQPLLIPASAPLLTGRRSIVYVRLDTGGEPVFEGREVVLGPRAGDSYVVLSGLSEGERVVTRGAFKIDSELQIRAKPSMMSRTMPSRGDAAAGGGRPAEEGGAHEGHAEAGALTPLYDAYFDIQMSLAGDDLEQAASAGALLADVTGRADPHPEGGALAEAWDTLSLKISRAASGCASAPDISACRESFDRLSEAVIELHLLFGHAGARPFFLTYCPMANEDRGAFWLQEVDTVYNSHYGAMMLRCGEIRERLEPSER